MSISSIRTLLIEAAQTHPDKTALIHNEEQLSYGELLTRVNQVALYLQELDLPRGSRIGLYSNKSIPQVVAILPEQVEYIIDDCSIQCIITDRLKLESIEEINFSGHIISFETAGKDIPSFEEIFKYYNKPYSCQVNGHDNAAITYSFGLTGTPKGIVLSHRNLIDSARVVSQYLGKLGPPPIHSALGLLQPPDERQGHGAAIDAGEYLADVRRRHACAPKPRAF